MGAVERSLRWSDDLSFDVCVGRAPLLQQRDLLLRARVGACKHRVLTVHLLLPDDLELEAGG